MLISNDLVLTANILNEISTMDLYT